MLGMGSAASGDMIDPPDLTNAGKIPVTETPGGASYFHHADSFAMMRGGGHLDICVLGAFQVSQRGGISPTGIPGPP